MDTKKIEMVFRLMTAQAREQLRADSKRRSPAPTLRSWSCWTFHFLRNGAGWQFSSSEMELSNGSALLRWDCRAVWLFGTGAVQQFSSSELELLTSSVLESWPVLTAHSQRATSVIWTPLDLFDLELTPALNTRAVITAQVPRTELVNNSSSSS